MVTQADILFWTGYTVTDDDALRYSTAAETHLIADGGGALTGETRTEALCYFIASRIANSNGDAAMQSESIGGYSYSRKTSVTSSQWLDMYHELIPSARAGTLNGRRGSGEAKRVDKNVVVLNRRFV